jgi:CheY-like chemotaxis protein
VAVLKTTKQRLKPVNIFLAEDNPADIFLVEMALKERSFQYVLRAVSDGAEALDCVARFGVEEPVPDLALLDLNLPRHEGASIIRSIREKPCCRHTKIIVMSSSIRQLDRDLAAQFDASFFSKPSDLASFLELGALIESLFNAQN